MPKLPVIKAKELCKFLEKQGFIFKRSSGSHRRYYHQDGRRGTVPYHNKPLKKGTLMAILRETKNEVEILIKYLKKK